MDNNFSQEEIDKIIDMYTNKIDIDIIIKELNSDEHNIREILKQYQIDRKYNTWSDELYTRGIQLYNNGKTNSQISYELLVSENGFAKALKKKGIKKRTYSENNRRFNRNSNYFDIIDTPNKAYFLGLLWADGHNNVGRRQITISLQIEDKYILDEFKEELEYEGDVRISDYEHRKNSKHKVVAILCIKDCHLSTVLESYGMVQNKSLILKFPNCVPKNLIHHFIRGYFDGDGCVSYDIKRQKGRAQIVGTLDVCNYISEYLSELGIKHNICNPKQSKGKNTYILTTSATKSSYLFLSWLYSDSEIKMIRKYNRFLQIKEKYYQINAA